MRDDLYIYWIDRKGGSHFHVKRCTMLDGSDRRYEPVVRTKQRKSPYSVIEDGGKVYIPCACILGKRGNDGKL